MELGGCIASAELLGPALVLRFFCFGRHICVTLRSLGLGHFSGEGSVLVTLFGGSAIILSRSHCLDLSLALVEVREAGH